jgi:hypothetical protein
MTQFNVDEMLCGLHSCSEVCEAPCEKKKALVLFARFTLKECGKELFDCIFSASRCKTVYVEIMKKVWNLMNMNTVPWYEPGTSRNEEVEACVVETVNLYLTTEKDWLRSLIH